MSQPKVRLTAGGLYCKLAMPIFGNASIADTDSTVAAPKAPMAAIGAKGASVAATMPATTPATTTAAVPKKPETAVASAPPSSGARPMGGFRAPPGSPLAQSQARIAHGRAAPNVGMVPRFPPSSGIAQGKGVPPSSGMAPTTADAAILQQRAAHARGFDAPASAPNPLASPAYLLSSAAQIEVMKARVHDSEVTMSRYSVEIQKKFALAAACIVFVLLGAPIGIRFPRGGVGLVIGVSIAVFALYYVGLIVGEDLANKLILDPVIAMWMANVLLTVVGVLGLIRVQRSGGSARGGDTSELLDTIRTWLAQRLRRIGVRADRRSRVTA